MASEGNSEVQPASTEGGTATTGTADLWQNISSKEPASTEDGVSPTTDVHEGAVGGAVSGAGAAEAAGTCSSKAKPGEQAYHVKWIKWRGNTTPIITQNENGPCPLIAIMNVLLLRGTVQIPQMVEMVSSSQLVGYLGDCLLNRSLENASEGVQRNYEQNIHDAMEIITKLSTGLDVNVKFTGVRDFEYTQECVVFDLLSIALCHGWLYDPQNEEIVSAIGTCSYNQVVERIIASKSSKDENELHQGLVAEQFLESTAAQLTFYGLCELNTATEEGELCVFFRNNHFSTLIKHNNELCVLVTDQGFLTESSIVWETLGSVEGDSGFVDGEFNARPASSQLASAATAAAAAAAAAAANMSPDQQLDADYLVALSLQEDQQRDEMAQAAKLSDIHDQDKHSRVMAALSDHELALQLQEQEDLRLAQNLAQEEQAQQPQPRPLAAQAPPSPQPTPAQASSHKEKSCVLL